jgi:trehalose 6-phosphate synthase/phosphatase
MYPTITQAYRQATARLLLLDYDGTLADIKPTPPEAKPTPELLALLTQLAHQPHTTVVIVSGRNHTNLEEWLGELPLAFAAEHGLLSRDAGQKEWQAALAVDTSWKPEVQAAMQAGVDKAPGTFVEDKTDALVWHYRTATNENQAEGTKDQLLGTLQPLARRLGLRIICGSKVIEVQPAGVNKGLAAARWLNADSHPDFILAAGDDTTDEDLFKAMPEGAYTIKVGVGESVARFRVQAPANLLELLRTLTE